jgi:hypothetical protein
LGWYGGLRNWQRRAAIFTETERGRRRGEEPYSCTATTPDAVLAKVSVKSAALL